ncbi:MAG: four-carbon acid sugar kinase family protein [Muricoprocola sp.]
MVKLLIIADDFTGALDTGIQFAKQGIETQVFTGTDLGTNQVSKETQVLVIDSETRPMSAEEAYTAVKKIVCQAVEMGIEVIYKKTDSALRGNVGSELSAVLDGTAGKRICFIPAFPDAGRTTEKGIQYINGVKLENSSFGQDPFNPMKCSSVREIIQKQTDKAVRLAEKNQESPAQEQKQEIVVFDALENQDICRRIEELKEKDELRLLAGCAGFASFLPGALGLRGNYKGSVRKTEFFYVACGSLNPITERQIRYAQKQGFYRRNLFPEQKLCPDYYETARGKIFLDELAALCRKQKCIEVDTFDLEGRESTSEYAKRNGIARNRIRFSVSACHGKILRYLLEQDLDMTILLTGGDTLMGFMKEIGVNQIVPVKEVGQGTVLSKLYWKGKELQVLSKSGGFGEKEILVKLAGELTA